MQQPYGAPPRKSNTGLIIGIILGAIGLCCVLPLVLFGGAAWFGLNKVGGFATCSAAYRDLHRSIGDFAQANNGMLPQAERWQTDVQQYYAKRSAAHEDMGPFKVMPADGTWACKNEDGTTGIAFNQELSGKKLAEIKDPDNTPLIFEVETPSINANEVFKERDPKTGPSLMMGQKRSWIVLMVSGRMVVKDPQGKPLDIGMDGRR